MIGPADSDAIELRRRQSPERDEFLSEEDLDLRNLDFAALVAHWNLWLEQAQVTNALDEDLYSHGVFERTPRRAPAAAE